MRICILETDIPTDWMKADHGDFADMFVDWLSPAMPRATWARVAVHAGADLPDPAEHDGYMISGCRHGVYDDLPWMAPLTGFLQTLRDRQIPVGGVCFGHQIMAQAYGARVEKSDRGWVLGADSYEGRTAFAVHQDQVQTPPERARFLGGSARCPIGRIAYEFPALSVQYHPEFTAGFMANLLAYYGGRRIDSALTEAAARTLSQQTHVAELARDFAEMFEASRPAQDG